MADSWGDFWERLIVDGVIVLVVGFLAQGLWFWMTDLLAEMSPKLEPSLMATSARLGVPWFLGLLAGLGWCTWKAWSNSGEMAKQR